jgi:magnesium-transporting ATPase (P-type)
MLTGDKGSTARMIGIECGMIPKSSLKVKGDTESNSVLVRLEETNREEKICEDLKRIKAEIEGKTY